MCVSVLFCMIKLAKYSASFTKIFFFAFVCLFNFTLSLRHTFKNKNYFNERKRTCACDRRILNLNMWRVWYGLCCDSYYFFLLFFHLLTCCTYTLALSLIKTMYAYKPVSLQSAKTAVNARYTRNIQIRTVCAIMRAFCESIFRCYCWSRIFGRMVNLWQSPLGA